MASDCRGRDWSGRTSWVMTRSLRSETTMGLAKPEKTDQGGVIMKLTLRNRRRLAVCAALVCGVIVLPATGLVASAASGAPASVARCSAASTEVWAAVEGDGTAGTVFYELEFSNIGHQTCTLRGYPDVWAITLTGHETGKPALHRGVPGTVTLRPGATAHAILGVVDTGALCSGPGVLAAGLRESFPPARLRPRRRVKPTRWRTSPFASAPTSRR